MLSAIVFQGGDDSDQAFARSAVGVKVGGIWDSSELERAQAAILATDRFRSVQVQVESRPQGPALRVVLDPWPALQELAFVGDQPLPVRKVLFPELRKGVRPGRFRMERWVAQAIQRLQEAGYPKAQVLVRREAGDRRLVLDVRQGAPAVITACRIEGGRDLYPSAKLMAVAGIIPGRSLWTQDLQRQVAKRLRDRFVKDDRLEGRIEDFAWNEGTGELVFRVHVGPEVDLRFEGEWHLLSWKNRKSFVPIRRAASYNPELLDEGDRGILRYLRGMGYLDAQVSHRREILSHGRVRITYVIHPGAVVYLDRIHFQANRDLSEDALRKVAEPPRGLLDFGRPVAKPEVIDGMEDRLKDYYQGLGYADASLRRLPMERKGNAASVGFVIQERQKQKLASVELELPEDPAWQASFFAECLGLMLADRPVLEGPAQGPWRFRSDRRGMESRRAVIESRTEATRPGVRILLLKPDAALPLVRNDLALVLAAVRNRMNAMGIQRPAPKIRVEGDESLMAHIEVPNQPRAEVQRVVVQGSDRTQARAVFRDLGLESGQPLAPDKVYKAQANLGDLNVFRTLDVRSLGDLKAESQDRNWVEGDLLFQAQERPPWIVTSSFGYDKSQGYHVGLGVEQLNVGGMGRTIDYGIRAGNATIQNPTLRKWFPTGAYDRSVDMFSVGYTDPYFSPGSLDGILPDHTRLRAEASYIEEHQDVYLLRRRRVTSDLEWHVGSNTLVSVGYRFERAEVKPSVPDISDTDLALVSRNPGRSIVSAPHLQVVRDTRDSALDPTRGSFSSARLEYSSVALGSSSNSSFAKLEARQQWHWPVGYRASAGVLSFGVRFGAAYTFGESSQNLPLSERFFAGGPTTHRGVEPDTLGPFDYIGLRQTKPPYDLVQPHQWKTIPLGGQAMVLGNLEYRFPLFGQMVWGEVFADTGQVYQYFNNPAPASAPGTVSPAPPVKEGRDAAAYPPLMTALGAGLILKIGVPIKVEYAADIRRVFGLSRTPHERDAQLRGILISAGFQF